MTLPRFYVREHDGYLNPQGGYGNAALHTEVMVLDSFYCHHVVRSFMPRQNGGPQGLKSLEHRRASAAALCAELNAEHDEQQAAA